MNEPKHFVGPGDDSADPANWRDGQLPQDGDDAIIHSGVPFRGNLKVALNRLSVYQGSGSIDVRQVSCKTLETIAGGGFGGGSAYAIGGSG